MIYSKIIIVAENRDRFFQILNHLTRNMKEGNYPGREEMSITPHEGGRSYIREDPCWDYETRLDKHLDIME